MACLQEEVQTDWNAAGLVHTTDLHHTDGHQLQRTEFDDEIVRASLKLLTVMVSPPSAADSSFNDGSITQKSLAHHDDMSAKSELAKNRSAYPSPKNANETDTGVCSTPSGTAVLSITECYVASQGVRITKMSVSKEHIRLELRRP
jgi:hypothetical protein